MSGQGWLGLAAAVVDDTDGPSLNTEVAVGADVGTLPTNLADRVQGCLTTNMAGTAARVTA